MGLGRRLYRGEIDVDFVGRRKLWYSLSGFLLIVSTRRAAHQRAQLGRGVQGRVGLPFKAPQTLVGRRSASLPARRACTSRSCRRPATAGGSPPRASTEGAVTKVENAISKDFGVPVKDVDIQSIGASWGGEVSNKAWIGLVVFMLAIILYLSMAFEPKMALAAIVALIHDLVITAGVYAWSGFEVTPATLLGFLTILGYSLYDAVVVFDMIKEVTGKLGTRQADLLEAANNAAEPHADPVAEHLAGRDPAGGGDPVHRHHAVRRGHAEGPVAGAVRRHDRRHLLLAVRRDAAAGDAEGAGAEVPGHRPAAAPPPAPRAQGRQEAATAKG